MSEDNASGAGPTLAIHPTTAAGASDAPATPSEAIVSRAIQAAVLDYTKASGEPGSISVRKPDILAPFRLVEALGDLAANQTYMGMVQPLLYIGAMDGQPEGTPSSKLEVEALIARLGEPGMDALLEWYHAQVIAPMMAAMESAEKAARAKEGLKN